VRLLSDCNEVWYVARYTVHGTGYTQNLSDEFNFGAHSAVSHLAADCDHVALSSTVSAAIHSLSSLLYGKYVIRIVQIAGTMSLGTVRRQYGPCFVSPRILKLVLCFWKSLCTPVSGYYSWFLWF
jgi:hypothetical protein